MALVILDAKRNDIGNTAEAYAREAFERYGADAVTVNPYMGEDSVRPFLARPDRGAVLLCRTSNPGARDFQDLLIDGEPLYRRVAARAAAHWNEHRNLMLVVGATCPAEMAELRRAHPALWFLVPGIGAQGGDLESILAAGLDAQADGPPDQLLPRHHLRGRRQERSDPRRGGGAARCDQPQAAGGLTRRRDDLQRFQASGRALGIGAAERNPVLAGGFGLVECGVRPAVNRFPVRIIGQTQARGRSSP